MQQKWCPNSVWNDEVLWSIIIVTYFTFDAIYVCTNGHISQNLFICDYVVTCHTIPYHAILSYPIPIHAMLFTFSFNFCGALHEVLLSFGHRRYKLYHLRFKSTAIQHTTLIRMLFGHTGWMKKMVFYDLFGHRVDLGERDICVCLLYRLTVTA